MFPGKQIERQGKAIVLRVARGYVQFQRHALRLPIGAARPTFGAIEGYSAVVSACQGRARLPGAWELWKLG